MDPPWSQMNLVFTASPVQSIPIELVDLVLSTWKRKIQFWNQIWKKKILKKNTLFAGSTCSGGDKSSVVLMDIVEPDLSRLDKLNLEAALFKDLPRDVCETDFLKDHLQEMMMLKDEQEKVLKMSS